MGTRMSSRLPGFSAAARRRSWTTESRFRCGRARFGRILSKRPKRATDPAASSHSSPRRSSKGTSAILKRRVGRECGAFSQICPGPGRDKG